MRLDALAKVSGAHRYPTDYPCQDMLWVKLARSIVPHGEMNSLDVEQARRVPGVVAVLTAEDITGLNGYGLIVPDQPVLCESVVRYVGEPYAIVIADSDHAARQGIGKIAVEIVPLPPVVSPSHALLPSTAPLHPDGNLCSTLDLGANATDVARAFASATYTYALSYRTPRQAHVFLEVEGGAAWFDGEGQLVVAAGGQNPLLDRAQIAAALRDGNPSSVRVLNVASGGAFGGKEDCSVQIPLALAAVHTGRACRFTYDRDESLIAGVKRHPFEVSYRTAADSEGQLLALDVQMLVDAGAYTNLTPGVLALAAEHVAGAYNIACVRVRGRAAFTNNGLTSAFRGFGNPQVLAGLEQHIDHLARAVGVSATEIRRRNLRGHAGGLDSMINIEPDATRSVLDAMAKAESVPREVPQRSGLIIGRGQAFVVQGYGLGVGVENGATVTARLGSDGLVSLDLSSPDMGTGVHSTYARILADELGISAETVRVSSGDSSASDTGSSNASRSLFIVGNAVKAAATELRERVVIAAARTRDAETADARMVDGAISVAGETITLGEVAAIAGPIAADGTFAPSTVPASTIIGVPHHGYACGGFQVEVEVDTYTGTITVLSVFASIDGGRIVDEELARSQIEGAIAQGIGFALYEDATYSEAIPQNTTLATYILPTALDVPAERISIDFAEHHATTNPLGVKGIAELGVAPMAPAIANAVFDAISHRFEAFPIRAEHVLAALSERDCDGNSYAC